MATVKSLPLKRTTVETSTVGGTWFPVSDWTDAAGIESLRARGEVRSLFGPAQVVPAYQLCNDPRSPDAAVAIPFLQGVSGWANSDGTYDVAAILLAVSTDARAFIRFGFIVKSTTAGTTAGGSIAAYVQAYS